MESLTHPGYDCKYHVVFLQKFRRKTFLKLPSLRVRYDLSPEYVSEVRGFHKSIKDIEEEFKLEFPEIGKGKDTALR